MGEKFGLYIIVIAGLWLLYEWPAATIIALIPLAMVCHMLMSEGGK
jgi:hypothetical protein